MTTKVLTGKKLQKHISDIVTRAMIAYAPEVAVTKKELQHDLRALRAWRLRDVEDWFYVYDAIGSALSEKQFEDPAIREFYLVARAMWRYDDAAHGK